MFKKVLNIKFIVPVFTVLSIVSLPAGCGPGRDTVIRPNYDRAYEGPRIPIIIIDPEWQATWLTAHFWDQFDFRDTMRLRPAILDEGFMRYATALPYVEENHRNRSLQAMLDNAALGGTTVLERFAGLCEDFLGSRKYQSRSEDAYICVLDKLLSMPEVDSLVKLRYRVQLDLASRNRPGAVASEIVFTQSSGVRSRLSEIEAEYTVLMFYDPECQSCGGMADWMNNSPTFMVFEQEQRLQFVAIYTGEDQELWRKHLDKLPRAWIVGCDPGQIISQTASYDTDGVPLLYLLDRDKRVVLKEPTAENLEAWFYRLQQSEGQLQNAQQ